MDADDTTIAIIARICGPDGFSMALAAICHFETCDHFAATDPTFPIDDTNGATIIQCEDRRRSAKHGIPSAMVLA